MENFNTSTPGKDPRLWALAQKRVGFKRDLVLYVVINAFLWLIWLLMNDPGSGHGIPWPVWPTAGWGLAMVIEYFSIYKYPKENAAEKEYQKLEQNK